MGILARLVFGLIAGAPAHLLFPGEDPGGGGFMGILISIAVGIPGAVVGGFIAVAPGFAGVTGFNLGSFLTATGRAVLALAAWRAISRRTHALS